MFLEKKLQMWNAQISYHLQIFTNSYTSVMQIPIKI